MFWDAVTLRFNGPFCTQCFTKLVTNAWPPGRRVSVTIMELYASPITGAVLPVSLKRYYSQRAKQHMLDRLELAAATDYNADIASYDQACTNAKEAKDV
jgi:hypothetical protein